MTDKEIALDVGRKLIAAQFRIAAMAGELSMYRDMERREAPCRLHVEETLGSPALSHGFQEGITALEDALAEANPEDLLRSLYTSLARE